jgi:hypothetical protein
MSDDSRVERLAVIETEKTALRQQMAVEAAAFCQAAAEWVKTAWHQAVERAVNEHPDQVAKLADSGELSGLKQRVRELAESARETVDGHLNSPTLWSHIDGTVYETDHTPRGPDKRHYESYSPRPPRVFDDAIRRLKGEVLAPLDDAGLLEPRDREAAKRGGNGYRYPYSLDWPAQLKAPLAAYSKTYQRFVELDIERGGIVQDIKSEQTAQLWDQA